MSLLDALVEAAGGRQRVRRAAIWRAFQAVHPVEAAAGDARDRLASRLTALAADGVIALPSPKGRAWDRSARPAMPEWIAFPPRTSTPPGLDVGAIPWAPELAFMASWSNAEHVDDALAVQAFLARGGRDRPLVPLRERSIELFGDEKRLDRLLRTPLFGAGALDLATLRCFPMAPPLAFEPGPPAARGRPCLVVENHHTWWSFCRWNEATAAYSAVVYGAGGGFGREAVLFLAERCAAWEAPSAHYFGDLDRDGLVIPWRATTRFAAATSLHILPAVRWYALLLDRAQGRALPVGAPLDPGEAIGWLPSDLARRAQAWFARGIRLPQELVGTEVLASQGPDREPDPALPF